MFKRNTEKYMTFSVPVQKKKRKKKVQSKVVT